ncbi:MAG: hypothetical protein FLDDKLPJ_03097 [Phycisphaerae bacterium]|nr:hypothetical protein [Phycisphaerae bacterium]
MFDVRDGLLGVISAVTVTLGGCLSGGCTRAFGEATLEQQIEAFKQTTEHLVHLAERTDAAYTAEFEYDGEDAEAYLKQSAGLRVPVRVRLGVFGNAKQGRQEHETAGAGGAGVQPAVLDSGGGGGGHGVGGGFRGRLRSAAGGVAESAGAGRGTSDGR